MTNPGDAIGTNGAYGGRTSVNAFNDVLSAFSGPGIVQGWACKPNSGLTVSLGGADGVRDVAIAENDIGQRTTIDNISVQPVDVTLAEAPTLGSRIDTIVAYVNNPPEIDESTSQPPVDNPDVCGLIVVSGSVATVPTAPTENMIREAITADGASGVSAYYVVLATVSVGTGVSVITANDITAGPIALVENASVPDGSITSDKLDWSTIDQVNYSTTEQKIGTWIDGKPLYRRVFTGTVHVNSDVIGSAQALGIGKIIRVEGTIKSSDGQAWIIPFNNSDEKKANVYVSEDNNRNIHLIVGSYMDNSPYTLVLTYTRS